MNLLEHYAPSVSKSRMRGRAFSYQAELSSRLGPGGRHPLYLRIGLSPTLSLVQSEVFFSLKGSFFCPVSPSAVHGGMLGPCKWNSTVYAVCEKSPKITLVYLMQYKWIEFKLNLISEEEKLQKTIYCIEGGNSRFFVNDYCRNMLIINVIKNRVWLHVNIKDYNCSFYSVFRSLTWREFCPWPKLFTHP